MLTNEITFLIKQHIIKNASSRIREQKVGLKKKGWALAGWLSWLEHGPVHKVAGSIPSKGTYVGCVFATWSEHVWEVTDKYFSVT